MGDRGAAQYASNVDLGTGENNGGIKINIVNVHN
jgi:hypothetical protein